MKIQSMTGFGKAEKTTKTFYARIELKSVNNRYLETQFKLPKSLLALEGKMRGALEEYLSRGSVFCFVQYESFTRDSSLLRVNEKLLEDYLKLINKLKKKLGGNYTVDLSEMVKIPEMVTVIPREQDESVVESRVLPLFGKACSELAAMRSAEGRRLVRDITLRVRSFRDWIIEVKKSLPGRQKDYLEKARIRVENLIKNKVVPDEERLMTELGILSEKLDVTEEIIRFQSHIELFLETVRTSTTPGKKLGFLLQEMLREVNTLGSKCQNSPIQHQCVSMKEKLEIVREQIQNIE